MGPLRHKNDMISIVRTVRLLKSQNHSQDDSPSLIRLPVHFLFFAEIQPRRVLLKLASPKKKKVWVASHPILMPQALCTRGKRTRGHCQEVGRILGGTAWDLTLLEGRSITTSKSSIRHDRSSFTDLFMYSFVLTQEGFH